MEPKEDRLDPQGKNEAAEEPKKTHSGRRNEIKDKHERRKNHENPPTEPDQSDRRTVEEEFKKRIYGKRVAQRFGGTRVRPRIERNGGSRISVSVGADVAGSANESSAAIAAGTS